MNYMIRTGRDSDITKFLSDFNKTVKINNIHYSMYPITSNGNTESVLHSVLIEYEEV